MRVDPLSVLGGIIAVGVVITVYYIIPNLLGFHIQW